ncbi:phage holin [Listeria monocytogenes]|nr:phage holin [Listeria monocytogenes]EAD6049450.1 phage holin [Listeria monocytogenes]EAD6071008.1 phage holin [Listeria monocytogenes]EAD6081016.1 phage holin [Listeria monocytogenes]EAD6262987.1 phage holin [Listeria monocytogenes]
MKNINWKVRFKNKTWVIAMIAALFFIVQAVLLVFNVSWDYNELLQRLITVVAGIFAFWGLIIDPTTAGTADSELGLNKNKDVEDDK